MLIINKVLELMNIIEKNLISILNKETVNGDVEIT